MQATFDNKTNLLSANVRSCVDNSVLYNIATTHNLWGRTVTLLKDANPAGGANPSPNANSKDAPIVGAIYWRERLFEVHGIRRSVSDIKRKPPGFGPRLHSPKERHHHKKKDVSSREPKKHDKKKPRPADKETDKSKSSNNNKSRTIHAVTSDTTSTTTCTSCLSFPAVVFTQIGLGDWWRGVACNTRYWRWGPDRTEYELVYHHEQWKALINWPGDHDETQNHDDERRPATAGAAPGPGTGARPVPGHHTRPRSASTSFANPLGGRPSGFSTATRHSPTNSYSQQVRRHSRHSSAQFSIGTLVADDEDEKHDFGFELIGGEEELTEEELKEERRTRASLYIPYRDHLFRKTKPAVLRMKKKALLKDEVFLLLVMIYEETKRQDRTNSSGGW